MKFFNDKTKTEDTVNETSMNIGEGNLTEENPQARKRLEQIIMEAEEAKAVYPDLSLDVEFENSDFRRLMAAGIPVLSAYELIHRDEIMSAAMESATKRTAKKVISAIQSGAKRPAENGAFSSTGAIVNDDPKKMSRQERRDIKDRVRRGEKIYM